MQVVLMIEGQEGVSWEEWLKLAHHAEALGFDGLFRSDHVLSLFEPSSRSSMDAWSTLAGLAARTSRVRLGTVVSPQMFRQPATLARTVSTVDQISGGRVELGLGAGWYEPEHKMFGYEFPAVADRFDRFEEYAYVVHKLLAERSPITWTGSSYRLDQAELLPAPVQEGGIPLILGGMARRRSASLAARLADEYNVYDSSPEKVGGHRTKLARACDEVGRSPETLRLSVAAKVLIGVDQTSLRRRAKQFARFQHLSGPPEEVLSATTATGLVGTPDQVVERMAQYGEQGVGRVMMQVFPHNDFEAIELIGNEVIPRAKELATL